MTYVRKIYGWCLQYFPALHSGTDAASVMGMNINLSEDQKAALRKMVGVKAGDVAIAEGPFASEAPYRGRAAIGKRGRVINWGVVVGSLWLNNWVNQASN